MGTFRQTNLQPDDQPPSSPPPALQTLPPLSQVLQWPVAVQGHLLHPQGEGQSSGSVDHLRVPDLPFRFVTDGLTARTGVTRPRFVSQGPDPVLPSSSVVILEESVSPRCQFVMEDRS